MTFVPFVPPPSPSPRARELSIRLRETIEHFRRDNPGTTSHDVKLAMTLATTKTGARNQAVVAAVLALMLGLGVLAFFFAGRQASFGNQWMILAVIIAAGIFTVALAAIRRRG